MLSYRSIGFAALVSAAMIAGRVSAQTTVFSADFESNAVAADIGTLSFTGPGTQSIATVDGAATGADWGSGALWADRSSSSGGDPGFAMSWDFTDPVALDGASVDFDFVLRRTNTSGVKSHFVTGFDSNGSELFSVMLIDRVDGGLANIADYLDNGDDSDERQRQTVGYVDPLNGVSMFAAADLASGSIPDSNDRTSGADSFEFFFGNDNRDTVVSEEQAGVFNVSLSETGWTLDAQGFEASTLADFATNEFAYSDSGVIDLARIEVAGQTVQAGGYWDNLSVSGDVIAPPEPLKLRVYADGEIRLLGGSPGGTSGALGIEIDAIQITSADAELDGGSLDASGYTGLGGGAGFPAGDGSGDGWEVGLANSDTFISELFLTGSSLIANDADVSLGSGFVPGGSEDLEFLYRVAGQATTTVGIVEYIDAGTPLPGDADGDGDVDGDDLIAVQTSFGNVGGVPLLGDADFDGDVDGDDLIAVQANFGAVASVAVPEPSAALLAAAGLVAAGGRRRR